MRLSELIAGLHVDELYELAMRVIPGAQDIDRNAWPHNLEMVLVETGHVEQTLFARRPPVVSLLLRLVDAENHVVSVDEVSQEIAMETVSWCDRVSAEELANRIPEKSFLYRRMLEAAWRNDLALDASEARMLRLLRQELGLLPIEHFLLAYHSSIQPYWRNDDALHVVIDALREHGVLFLLEPGTLALPNELVRHVRRALDVWMSRSAARRLLQELDSGRHLKSALDERDLPISGSKQNRIDRIADNFVPIREVLDTMHIDEARALARRFGLPVSGAKEDLVSRIVDCFATGADLSVHEEEQQEEVVEEERALSRSAYGNLFEALKGHQLQRLLMAFELRHSGTKEVRIGTLWDSPFSEATLLAKLKNADLSDLLRRNDLNLRGSKAEKIARLIDSFRAETNGGHEAADDGEIVENEDRAGENDEGQYVAPDGLSPASKPPTAGRLLSRITALLGSVELSSKSPNRFDPLRAAVGEVLGLSPERVGVKYLGDSKNHRNRFGEALRAHPAVLILLTPEAEHGAVLQAARERHALSTDTIFATLLDTEAVPRWACGEMMAAAETPLFERLRAALPPADFQLVGLPRPVVREQDQDLVARVEGAVSREWVAHDGDPDTRIRRALEAEFERDDVVIRTKHISDGRNVGNRISEAVGAGCGALVLIVAQEIADLTREEVARHLSGVREPRVAVVVAETSDGGYSWPVVVSGGDRDLGRTDPLGAAGR